MSVRSKIQELSPSIFLLYSQLLEQMDSPTRVADGLSFKRRKVAGKSYWFRKVKIGSTEMELSLGRESDELLALIEQEKMHLEDAKSEAKTREDLVKMLSAGGASSIDQLSGRILTLMEGAGVFAAGGVLIGSHAFNVYGNMLGYKFPPETSRTADIDLSISIGVTKKTSDLRTTILESGLGFLEVPALNRKAPSTSYKIRGSEVKVDLLTPLTSGPDTSKPIYMSSLKSYASPVRFLDYLLKDPISAVVVWGNGIMVNVPEPARYAIHKFILSKRRPVSMQVKAIKDISQAACLLETLSMSRPADLYPALLDVRNGKSRKLENQMLEGFQSACTRKLLTKDAIEHFENSWSRAQKSN